MNLQLLESTGVRIVAGSDAGNIGTLHGPAIHREFELMAAAGMRPAEILVAATKNAAAVMGREADLGTLQKGKYADLVILDADPLRDIQQRPENIQSHQEWGHSGYFNECVEVNASFGHTSNVKAENDNRFHLDTTACSDSSYPRFRCSSTFRIERLDGPVQDCNRLLDLGVTPGEEVVVTHTAPLGDPLVIRIRGASLALRKREAAWIWVV